MRYNLRKLERLFKLWSHNSSLSLFMTYSFIHVWFHKRGIRDLFFTYAVMPQPNMAIRHISNLNRFKKHLTFYQIIHNL